MSANIAIFLRLIEACWSCRIVEGSSFKPWCDDWVLVNSIIMDMYWQLNLGLGLKGATGYFYELLVVYCSERLGLEVRRLSSSDLQQCDTTGDWIALESMSFQQLERSRYFPLHFSLLSLQQIADPLGKSPLRLSKYATMKKCISELPRADTSCLTYSELRSK